MVQGGELAHHDAERPPVRGDVMHGGKQYVLLFGAPEKGEPHGHVTGQAEGPHGLFMCQPLYGRGLLTAGQGGDIDHGHLHLPGLADDLHRRPVPGDDAGPERLVAAHNFCEGPLQGPGVESARYAQHRGNIIEGVAGDELVQEPEALLGKGEGHLPFPLHRHQGYSFVAGAVGFPARLEHGEKKLPLLRRELRYPFQEVFVHYVSLCVRATFVSAG